MPASDVVTVNISKATASLSQAGFGVALIAAYHTQFANRVKEYGSLDELVDDGFATKSPVYLAAQALLSQKPKPKTFKVGRREMAWVRSHAISCVAKDSTTYTVELNGIAHDYTAPEGGTTAAEVAEGLAEAINASSVPVSAVVNSGGTFEIMGDVPGDYYTVAVSDDRKEGLLSIANTTADPGLDEDLNAIVAEDDAWYGLLLDSDGDAEIVGAAAWAESRRKIFGACTATSSVKDGAVSYDIGSMLKANAYERTYLVFHDEPHRFAHAGIMGQMFPKTPGSATWAHKQLSGVPVSRLPTGAQSALESKNVNYYVPQFGRGNFFWGYASSGEWIDTTRGSDWTQARVEEEIFALKAANDKIPFTNQGAGAVGNAVLGVLRRGVRNQLFAPDPAPTVTWPDVNDPSQVGTQDKLARRLPNVVGAARFAGAIHKSAIEIRVAP